MDGGARRRGFGFRRDAYHELLWRTAPIEAMAITRDGGPVGYCYISKSDHIGPLAIGLAEYFRDTVEAGVRADFSGDEGKI